MYYIIEVQDDAYATHRVLDIAPTLKIAEEIVLEDYFEGDEEFMAESKVGEREYMENCKGCIIATEDDLRELVEDEKLDISDLNQYGDFLGDWFTDYLENGF